MVEYRSSYSPIIREMLDFNCGLFTADGRMVANSEQIPAQLGLMQFALESVLAKWGDDVDPGDAFLDQQPVHGRHPHARPAGLHAALTADGALIGLGRARSPTTSTSAAASPAPRAPSAPSSSRRG